MAEKNAKVKAPTAPAKANGTNERQQRQDERESRLARKKRYLDNKIRKAGQDDYEVISRRTDDTNDFIGLLNSADNLILQLRRRMDRQENLTAEVVSKFLKRYQGIREELNSFNAEVSALLGYEYVPARGMTAQSAADNKTAKAA